VVYQQFLVRLGDPSVRQYKSWKLIPLFILRTEPPHPLVEKLTMTPKTKLSRYGGWLPSRVVREAYLKEHCGLAAGRLEKYRTGRVCNTDEVRPMYY
jgi:hypothetical protein